MIVRFKAPQQTDSADDPARRNRRADLSRLLGRQ